MVKYDRFNISIVMGEIDRFNISNHSKSLIHSNKLSIINSNIVRFNDRSK